MKTVMEDSSDISLKKDNVCLKKNKKYLTNATKIRCKKDAFAD